MPFDRLLTGQTHRRPRRCQLSAAGAYYTAGELAGEVQAQAPPGPSHRVEDSATRGADIGSVAVVPSEADVRHVGVVLWGHEASDLVTGRVDDRDTRRLEVGRADVAGPVDSQAVPAMLTAIAE